MSYKSDSFKTEQQPVWHKHQIYISASWSASLAQTPDMIFLPVDRAVQCGLAIKPLIAFHKKNLDQQCIPSQ